MSPTRPRDLRKASQKQWYLRGNLKIHKDYLREGELDREVKC